MYLEELDARAVLWLPLIVVPVLMHILHVAAAVTSLHKMKHMCVGVVVDLIHLWLHPGFHIHYL